MIGMAALFLSSVISLKAEDQPRSMVENRTLAQIPDPDTNSVLDGTFGTAYEKYSLDQFIFRDQALMRYFKVLNILGENERNGYIRTEDGFCLKIQGLRSGLPSDRQLESYASARVEALEILESACRETGAVLISLQIPHKSLFYYDKYPELYPYDREYESALQDHLDRQISEHGIDLIELAPEMEKHKAEYLYFRTDNHYTFLGAYYTYRKLLDHINTHYGEKLSFPDWEDCEYFREKERFVGSYLRNFGDDGSPTEDYLEYVMPYDMPEYTRYENGKISKLKVLNTGNASYARFMSGDKSNTVIATDRPDLPNILYIGLSYSNALEVMSIYSFNEMHSIDPRYFTGSISEYIRSNDLDYVVVIRDDLYENNTSFKASIR